TTHLLENLLDGIRRGEMALRADMIDIFLETKDVLSGQLDTYRNDAEPAPETYERICAVLKQLAQEQREAAVAPTSAAPAQAAAEEPVRSVDVPAAAAPAAEPVATGQGPNDNEAEVGGSLKITLSGVAEKDQHSILEEIANLGRITAQMEKNDVITLWVETTCSADDIVAVCCFIIDADQIDIEPAKDASSQAATPQASAPAPVAAPAAAPTASPTPPETPTPAAAATPAKAAPRAAAPASGGSDKEGGSIRVGVEKVDQVINLVGELVITQAMLAQLGSTLDPVLHDRLLNGMEQLERNARDLQEAVMSIRMMPMDYVFSR